MYWIHKRNISKEKSLQRMNYEGNGVWISAEFFFTAGTHDIILSKSKSLMTSSGAITTALMEN